jgi:hypothetical protein
MSDDLLESIVVTAFNRREYYEKAIDSVLPLVQGRSDVEVILLKNFVDEPVDHRLVAAGVQVASYSSPIAGATLRRAIELCRGRYIVFLDDDDLFRPTKLERFERALAQFPELSYYHNGYEMVLEDKAGLGAWERFSLIRSNRERVGSAVRVFTGPADEGLPPFLATENHEQNLSSTTVRRDVATRVMSDIERLPAMTDTIMLTAALISTGALVFDPSVETIVRRHRTNSSNQLRNVGQRLEVLGALAQMATAADAPPAIRAYLDLRIAREIVYVRLWGGEHSRAATLGAVKRLAGLYRTSGSSRDLAFLLLGTLECAVPTLVPRLRPLAAGG